MDPNRFDDFVQLLATSASRRRTLLALLGGIVAAVLPDADSEAARRHGESRRRRVSLSSSDRDKGEVRAAKKDGGNNGKNGGGGKKGGNGGKGNNKCKHGKKRCKKRCVDVQTNLQHCGRCGHACKADQRCQDGQCVDQGCAADCPNDACRLAQPMICLPPTCVFRGVGSESHGQPHDICPTCMHCHLTETKGGQEVCADNLCTGIACDGDQDCLAAFPGLGPGETFCQAAGAGCCGQTCVLACTFTDYGECDAATLAPLGSNTGCTWEIGLGNPDAACTDHGHCCHVIQTVCGGDGYCCRISRASCSADAECCGGRCADGECCIELGFVGCLGDDECCNLNCEGGRCCLDIGETCSVGSECCSGRCQDGECCRGAGGSCVDNGDCCGFGRCDEGSCCLPAGRTCSSSGECCDDLTCEDGRCGRPDPNPGGSTCRDVGQSCDSENPCCLNSFCNINDVCQCFSAPPSICGGSFGSCCGPFNGSSCVDRHCQ